MRIDWVAHFMNAPRVPGLASESRTTTSVTCLSAFSSAPDPTAHAMMLPGFIFLMSAA